jgi:NAD+ kinase
MKFGVIVNTNREKAISASINLIKWLKFNKIDFVLETDSARHLGETSSLDIEDMASECDAFVSLGGDGTLLRVTHYANSKPIIGINLGTLGFLAEFSEAEMYEAIKNFMDGNFTLENRTQFEVSVYQNGELKKMNALNDVVIEKGSYPRIPNITLSIDGNLVTSYRSDGIIIATSTGSTAYSMSAGGPIIFPKSHVFVITPICPHVLTVRPIIVSDEKTIEVAVETSDDRFILNCDGLIVHKLTPADRIKICKSPHTVNLMRNQNRSYYDVLRTKFHWSRDHSS